METSISLPKVKHKKGLTIVFAVDAEYCGFNVNLSKRAFELRLGFVILRVLTVSESLYNRFITVETLKNSSSHEINIKKG